MIYDRRGNLRSEAAFKTADKIGVLTDQLFKQLLKEGMTVVEGRALSAHLEHSVNISATIQLMRSQC